MRIKTPKLVVGTTKILSNGHAVTIIGDSRFYTQPLPNGRYLAYRDVESGIAGAGDTRDEFHPRPNRG